MWRVPRNGGKRLNDVRSQELLYYYDFMYIYRLELAGTIDDFQPVLVDLSRRELLKPLRLKYLADTE
jgi:hypothetical protein